ncbi:MAG TPA: PD-(D/E)XK nuclease family protein [Acidimicrobiales bacterium]|nr:PD-(D/E)XK nuclease family protein [Acidimicrobiales bacterium]
MTFVSYEGYEPPHLSHSTFDSYRSCGMKMALQKVYRVEQRPGWSSIGGSALHSCIETIEEYELADVDADALFEDCFKHHTEEAAKRSPSYTPDQYHVAGRGKKTASWWLEEGPRMVHRWLDWRKATGWTLWTTPAGTPAIEVELNFTLNGPDGEIPVKGFIDSVWRLPSGQLIPLDVKSGRKPDEPIQLGLYKVGMQKVFGEDVAWGYFWDANKGDHGQPVSLDLYTEDYLAVEYAKAVRGINAGVFIARPNMNCADWCSSAAFCPAVGGARVSEVFPSRNT